jgi:hypothetical protein
MYACQVEERRVTWVPPPRELAAVAHGAATAQGRLEAKLHTHDHGAVIFVSVVFTFSLFFYLNACSFGFNPWSGKACTRTPLTLVLFVFFYLGFTPGQPPAPKLCWLRACCPTVA